jgi:hypothetical protein
MAKVSFVRPSVFTLHGHTHRLHFLSVSTTNNALDEYKDYVFTSWDDLNKVYAAVQAGAKSYEIAHVEQETVDFTPAFESDYPETIFRMEVFSNNRYQYVTKWFATVGDLAKWCRDEDTLGGYDFKTVDITTVNVWSD